MPSAIKVGASGNWVINAISLPRAAPIDNAGATLYITDVEDNAYVIRSSQREFESAALNAVSLSKFVPGKKGGRVVNTRVRRIIVFSLDAN